VAWFFHSRAVLDLGTPSALQQVLIRRLIDQMERQNIGQPGSSKNATKDTGCIRCSDFYFQGRTRFLREFGQSAVVQGRFGHVATHATARAVAALAHQQLNFIFKTGGADTGFRVGQHEYLLDSASAILVNRWMPHAKLPSANGAATFVLTALPDPAWL